MYVYIYTHTYIYMHMCTYIHVHIYTYIHMYIYFLSFLPAAVTPRQFNTFFQIRTSNHCITLLEYYFLSILYFQNRKECKYYVKILSFQNRKECNITWVYYISIIAKSAMQYSSMIILEIFPKIVKNLFCTFCDSRSVRVSNFIFEYYILSIAKSKIIFLRFLRQIPESEQFSTLNMAGVFQDVLYIWRRVQ